jgi:hypothetical protein
MEYLARQDGRIPNPVFLQIHPNILREEGVMFTADVSNKAGVQIISLAEAVDVIDFEVLYTRTDWNDPAVKLRLQQAEKYELLVPNHVPMKYVRNLPNG